MSKLGTVTIGPIAACAQCGTLGGMAWKSASEKRMPLCAECVTELANTPDIDARMARLMAGALTLQLEDR